VRRLVVASANPDKVAEIEAILGGVVELVPRPADLADVVEDGDTLETNARLKAVAVARHAGAAAVADDTGLEVDALDGAPGVHSARFAGNEATYEDNVRKLLESLDGVPPERRTARFRTVAMVRTPGGGEVVGIGAVEGRIIDELRGEGGFGYDPVFAPTEGDGRTFGEMSDDEKHEISHRGRAFRALAAALGAAP
jgi:XTP/dITP diphosphohydrolase